MTTYVIDNKKVKLEQLNGLQVYNLVNSGEMSHDDFENWVAEQYFQAYQTGCTHTHNLDCSNY